MMTYLFLIYFILSVIFFVILLKRIITIEKTITEKYKNIEIVKQEIEKIEKETIEDVKEDAVKLEDIENPNINKGFAKISNLSIAEKKLYGPK